MTRDEFNPWEWDREMYRTGQAGLVVERAGHRIRVDCHGLSIDGELVAPTPEGLGPADVVRPHEDPREHPAFQVLPDGRVVYHNCVVAQINGPGDVERYGPDGQEWKTPASRQHSPVVARITGPGDVERYGPGGQPYGPEGQEWTAPASTTEHSPVVARITGPGEVERYGPGGQMTRTPTSRAPQPPLEPAEHEMWDDEEEVEL